jgi:3-oxoadipate enol-lactonase
MPELFVPVDGGELWAEDTGGDLPSLVLIHPGTGDSRSWDPLLPELTRSFRVVRYDSRGWGRSPAPTRPYTHLGDLVTVLDHVGVERAAIVGCSQGGDCAMGLAIAQPERVSALVLLCPGVSGYPWPEDPLGPEFDQAAEEGVDAVTEFMIRVWGAAGRTPEAEEQFRSAARALLAQGEHLQPNPPIFDRLGEIAVPTSLLVGDADRPMLIECDRQIAARIPGCELVEVPGVDHLPTLRVPDQVLELIHRTIGRSTPYVGPR